MQYKNVLTLIMIGLLATEALILTLLDPESKWAVLSAAVGGGLISGVIASWRCFRNEDRHTVGSQKRISITTGEVTVLLLLLAGALTVPFFLGDLMGLLVVKIFAGYAAVVMLVTEIIYPFWCSHRAQ